MSARAGLAVTLFGAAAGWFVLVVFHRPSYWPAHDVYGQFLPYMLYAVHALHHGGRGLLWNPFQTCGTPFFANSVTGLLYPPHLLFLMLPANAALHAVLIVNMVLGAVGMLLLGQEIGLGWTAALGGALVFELGDPMVQLSSWSPMHDGPWVWLPWAFLFCERALRSPSRGNVLGLAVVLALQLLPGFVLIAVLTDQLITLRVGWELLTRRGARPWRAALAVAVGLVVGPLLVAVQLIPAAELALASVRTAASPADMFAFGYPTLAAAITAVATRVPPVPFMVLPLVLAALAPLTIATRRLAVFYLSVAALFATLALKEAAPLLALYTKLPLMGATLRNPYRLFWVSGFCLAMLSALGLEALARGADPRALRWLRAGVAAVLVTVLSFFTPGGVRRPEAAALALASLAVAVATARPGLAHRAAWLAVAGVVIDLTGVPLRWPGRLLPSIESYWRYAPAFAAHRPPITAQDRVLLIPGFAAELDGTLMEKTPTVLRVRGFFDFEALFGRRFAEYLTMMRLGRPFHGMNDIYMPYPMATPSSRHRLFDTAAIHWLITSSSDDATAKLLDLRPVPMEAAGLQVFRNDAALGRARWVPHIEVVGNPDTLLERLASGNEDLAATAFVEKPPPSGFTGDAGAPRARTVRFVVDDPEHLAIDVDAPQRGFLVLADQYYPGWHATVNGAPVPILRANYLFRLVETPAGASRVEFRYRPTSLLVGAILSAVTLALLTAVVVRRRAPTPGRR